jgi:UDP-glucose 4-epimerase
MRILMTGASSFTGAWFAEELARAGHHVVATYRGPLSDYTGVRAEHVRRLASLVEQVDNTSFGDASFLDLAAAQPYDLLLHHAATMENYRSWDFDAISASEKNTRNTRPLLRTMSERGLRKVVVTGSVFEPFEGDGDAPGRAFNPYGLSKHISFEIMRLEAERFGLSLGKFVIPNPFGPSEEPRFTTYLAREWKAGRVPTVATPRYVRDNIHVSLLAKAYRSFCEALPDAAGVRRSSPSGYVGSQGDFARRVATELRDRTGWRCEVREAEQTDFSEPLVRTATEPAAAAHADWIEAEAWEACAEYYRSPSV